MLLAECGSASAEEMVAWFAIVPVVVGRTLITTLADAPLARVPSEHVTVPAACEQVPCEGVAESKAVSYTHLTLPTNSRG